MLFYNKSIFWVKVCLIQHIYLLFNGVFILAWIWHVQERSPFHYYSVKTNGSYENQYFNFTLLHGVEINSNSLYQTTISNIQIGLCLFISTWIYWVINSSGKQTSGNPLSHILMFQWINLQTFYLLTRLYILIEI